MTDIKALGATFQSSHGIERAEAMKPLAEHLGKAGTSATDILASMGKPDKIEPLGGTPIVQTMPGIMMQGSQHETGPSAADSQALRFIYHSQADQPSLCFEIDQHEKVLGHTWLESKK